MWRGNTFVLALLMAHEVASTCSAEQGATNLIGKARWVRFEIVLGRIIAIPLCGGRNRSAQSDQNLDLPRETLNFNGDREQPCFVYQLQDAQHTLTIKCVGRYQLSMLREPKVDSGERLLFMQSARGAVSLAIGPVEDPRVLTAESVWHLYLTEPETCEQHLLPLLAALRPDWSFRQDTEEIEALLCSDPASVTVPRKQMARLVAQLGSSRFPQRQAADREIRSLGILALPYLDRVDRTRLNGEQRIRIRRIREDFRSITPDTPERVAAWLSNDDRIWRGWREAPEPSRRQAAEAALAGILRSDISHGHDGSQRKRLADLPRVNATQQ